MVISHSCVSLPEGILYVLLYKPSIPLAISPAPEKKVDQAIQAKRLTASPSGTLVIVVDESNLAVCS